MSDPPGHPPTAMETDVKPPAGAAGPSDDGQQPVHGILKHHATTKKRPLVWDENNLENNEQERIERGPRMKIDEPKTPYQASHGLMSPQQLDDDALKAQSSSAGTLPDDLHLDERLADISREALKRREAESREWESEDEAAAPSSTDSSAKKKSKKDELHTSPGSHPGPTIVTAPHAAAAALDVDDAAVADVNLADPAVKGSLTPEQKHRVFAKKRDINYGKMGNLLKKHHDDDEEEE